MKQKKKKKVLFEHSHIKSRKLPQPNKKMECPVTFQTKKIISFPEFSINKDTKWNRTESSQKLKEYLNELINLQFRADSGDNKFSNKSATLKYLVKLLKQEHQYHHMGV